MKGVKMKGDETKPVESRSEGNGEDPAGSSPALGRRQFIGTVGAVGLGMAVPAGVLLAPGEVFARSEGASEGEGASRTFPGLLPAGAASIRRFPDFNGPWTSLHPTTFGGYDFVLCYMAEGVQGIDPESPNFPHGQLSNTSGLFEQFSLQVAGDLLPIAADTGERFKPIPSGVGGNESSQRSAEFWLRTILKLSDGAIRDDLWAAINYCRRMWGLDFDDPAADGMMAFGSRYQYPGSPDVNNQVSLLSPRIAVSFNEEGSVAGFARMAPTFLAPDTAYTVIGRAGKLHPTYTGGIVVNGIPTRTTAASPDWPGKVRDGGFWGGVVQSMDVLADIQAVARAERMFTTPSDPAAPLSGTTNPSPDKRGRWGGRTMTNPQGTGPKWGQWWRRVAPIVNIDVDDPSLLAMQPSVDATVDFNTAAHPGNIPGTIVPARPAARPNWPIGFLPRGTDFFWGNYNLHFGTEEPTLTLHYQSEVPTAFRPADGIPHAFICDMNPNPGSAEIKSRSDMDTGTGIGLFDSTGEVSGFPDPSNSELDGQTPVGAPDRYGRVHGTSINRAVRKDGVTTYHFRNYLLWPPTLNVTNLGDPRQKNFGNINWTIPALGDLQNNGIAPIVGFN